MALASTLRAAVDLDGNSTTPGSCKSRWEQVHDNAETTTSTPTTIANLTTSATRWVRVGPKVTRIAAIRQKFQGTLGTGATITVIGCDRLGDDDAPASGAKYRTILSALALGTTTDITDGSNKFTSAQTNSGDGWDLLGDEAFLVAVTTAADVSTGDTVVIEAKLVN